MTSKGWRPASSVRRSKDTGGNPFSTRDDSSDIALVVEGKKLFVSKLVLSLASPVFKTLFNGEFSDKAVMTISSRKYDDFLELLLCIYPSTNKPITMTTIDAVLPLANEYGIASVKKRCEELIRLEVQLEDRGSRDRLVHLLYLTDTYNLPQGLHACVDKMKYTIYSGRNGFKKHTDFEGSSMHAKYSLISERLTSLETAAQAIFNSDVMASITKLKDPFVNSHCVGCKKGQVGNHTSRICEAITGSNVRDFVLKVVKLAQVMK